MIIAIRAFFLLSVFAFLLTHGRTLPEDILKISSTTENEWTSIFDNIRRTSSPPPPPPYVAPPIRPGFLKTNSYVSGNPHDKIIMRPTFPSPPPPRVAPRPGSSISTVTLNAYDKIINMRRSIGRTPQSPPPPPYIAPPIRHQTPMTVPQPFYATEFVAAV